MNLRIGDGKFISKRSKFIKYFPIIAIIIVSGCAFIPGAMGNTISDDLEIEKDALEDWRLTYEWASNEARYIFDHDSDLFRLAWQELEAARLLDVEFNILAFAENETNTVVNETYMHLIMNHVNAAYIISDQSYSFAIHTFFTDNPDESSFILGETPSGIPYTISRFNWESKPIYYYSTVEVFLTIILSDWFNTPDYSYFLEQTMIQLRTNYSSFLSQNLRFMYAPDTIYTLDGRTNLYNLTQEPLLYFQDQMREAYENIWEGERAVSRLQSIVSIMTICYTSCSYYFWSNR